VGERVVGKPAALEAEGPPVADRVGDPPALARDHRPEQALAVLAELAHQDAVEVPEQAREVRRADLRVAPVAGDGEVGHPGAVGDLEHARVPDPGVDRVGGVVVGLGDHRAQQRTCLRVDVAPGALDPPQLGGEEHRLHGARRGVEPVQVVAAQLALGVDGGEGDQPDAAAGVIPRLSQRDRARDLVLPVVAGSPGFSAGGEGRRLESGRAPDRLGRPTRGDRRARHTFDRRR
jgi:hypothetical protein